MKGKIGVVVAAYNASDTIDTCVKSVIMQSYQNWEMYIVNDGSTDETGNMIELLSIQDNRIKAIWSSNGGKASAHKKAIDMAEGCEYLMFLDSDDYLIGNNLFDSLVTEISNEDADCICFDYWIKNHAGFGIKEKMVIQDKEVMIKELLRRKVIDGNLPYALYKFDVIKNYQIIKFAHTDYINKYNFLIASQKIIVLPIVGYFYYTNSYSQSHRDISEKDRFYYENVKSFTTDLLNKFPRLKIECEYFRFWVLLWTAVQLSKKRALKKLPMYCPFMQEFRENIKIYVHNKYFSNREKIESLLIYFKIYTLIFFLYSGLKRNVINIRKFIVYRDKKI